MTDYSHFLDTVAREIKADAHDGVRFHFLMECQKRGIIQEIPANWFDEGRGQPFPINWTASELSIFDNGDIPRPKKAAKTIRTTKTRFGGEWKAWTSAKVDFSKKAPWSHLISFFCQREIVKVVEQQIEAKFLDEQTKALLSGSEDVVVARLQEESNHLAIVAFALWLFAQIGCDDVLPFRTSTIELATKRNAAVKLDGVAKNPIGM